MTLYGRFRRRKLDPAVLGFEYREDNSPYFCTPQGAQIIGWAGVDGIHYCFIRRFGEMVFAVEPMGDVGNYVYPLAKTFEDFLRLLLACGDANILQQAHAMDRAQFDTFCAENPPTEEQTALLARISRAFSLTPMEDPFAYLKAIYEGFDRRTVPFTADYYEWVPAEPEEPMRPAWKVYYHGGFWSHRGHDRAGVPIPVGQTLDWGGVTVRVPAVYACAAGLVVDVCIGAEKAKIQAYLDEWAPYREQDIYPTPEVRARLEYLNPLELDFRTEASVNGKCIRQKHGTSRSWLPEDCLPEGIENELQSRWLIEQYELDPEMGWAVHRVSLPWATKRRPQIQSLALTLTPDPERIPGQRFRVGGAGESAQLTHPVTGTVYTLRVTDYAAQTIDAFRHDETREYPSHCVAMDFTTEPPLPVGAIQVTDSASGDRPRRKTPPPSFSPTATDDALIGIIGGADGPTALILSRKGSSPVHGAVSSLYFDAPAQIDWRVTFCETTRAPLKIIIA